MAAVLENRLVIVLLSAALAVGCASLTGTALEHQGGAARTGAALGAPPANGVSTTCHLAHGIEHVVYLQMENVHFGRELPAVPSDLEQMPRLLDFLQANGTLLAAGHTGLVTSPGGDLLTSVTGLYPDHHGRGFGDSWRYFKPDGTTAAASASTYWSTRVSDGSSGTPADSSYNLVTTGGRNVPAPWPAFTRAGCDVGAVGGPANMVLRNTPADLAAAFGKDSREAAEGRADGARAAADFTGLAIHCTGQSGACAGERGGRPDVLPDEPGGYSGFDALYGNRYVLPRLGVSGRPRDLSGRPVAGFPGPDVAPATALAYVATMQEHGVPVTYAYLADPHDPRAGAEPLRPGEPADLRQLRDYDQAVTTFVQRLGRDGLTPANTLFVVASGEGGDRAAAAPSPAGCDGIQTPCRYGQQAGAVQVDLASLLAAQGVPASFSPDGGAATAVWINGDPAPAAAPARGLERAAAQLWVQDPNTGGPQPLLRYLADRPEMRLLHMVSAEAARTPSFVMLARRGYLAAGAPAGCSAAVCTAANSSPQAPGQGYAEPGVNTAWLALAGPGVARRSLDASTWTDEADIRPTLLALTGLRDSYPHDGRVLSEALKPEALPPGIVASQAAYETVSAKLKQLDAPAGRVGTLSLAAATRSAASSSPGDADYRSYAARMDGFTSRRDVAAEAMKKALEEAAFGGSALDGKRASTLTEGADRLLAEMARA
ncbi:MAG: hypothetical protein DLM67_23165 [Candidatus Nephthysia bennettiae]|uniref:Alkaline phosphatase family protein n=1 Tax=Candidatus Nephthysia bennettiae TaxID=3127016 RepID=A0A934N7N4_9BACT|nr:hypothetical protein [Candidatus Dormibacteraeota bacterium]MBJ7613130.1 hypothetical protein [Candidatus Dormibacteraeota bacterium]PZR86896.1 MAG: hypothetical protein DLM67_23165 [Candidatus Dormibacteraeota bacterium]